MGLNDDSFENIGNRHYLYYLLIDLFSIIRIKFNEQRGKIKQIRNSVGFCIFSSSTLKINDSELCALIQTSGTKAPISFLLNHN